MLVKYLDKIQSSILIIGISILYSAVIGLLMSGVIFIIALLTMPELSKFQLRLISPYFTGFSILIGIYYGVAYLMKRKERTMSS